MPSTHTIRRGFAPVAVITPAAALAATSGGTPAAVGQPSPEWAPNAGARPAHNYDLANTRATTQTPIDSQTVSRLKVKRIFAFKGASGFGAFAPTPISLNAYAHGRLFVPWLDLGIQANASGPATSIKGSASAFKNGRGGLTAINAATGAVASQHKLPSMDFGTATVANDVVFTSDYAGTLYAFDIGTGKTLWSRNTPAGINSFPAVDGDTLLVGSAAPGFTKKPKFQLITYSLS